MTYDPDFLAGLRDLCGKYGAAGVRKALDKGLGEWPRETSQYAHRPSCDCVDCQDARRIARNPHLYGFQERPGANIPIRAYVIGLALSAVIILVGFAILWSVPGYAREGSVHPIKAPDALLRARADCPGTTTVVECRGRLREAYAAIEWQQKARAHDAKRAKGYGVQHALRLASALYGVPIGELERVAECESHLTPTSKNRTSTASGLFQFLDSTWARAGVPGFSVFDPYANATAAARLVRADGGWREWSCGFAA